MGKYLDLIPELKANPQHNCDQIPRTPAQVHTGFGKDELEELREIYRITVEQGHYLCECASKDQAERWAGFLAQKLPKDRSATVVRQRELNTFSIILRSGKEQDVIDGEF